MRTALPMLPALLTATLLMSGAATAESQTQSQSSGQTHHTASHAEANRSAHSAPAHTEPARTEPARNEPPKALGRFDDWTAATHQEGGQMVCYAFTRASASQPAIAGRGDVVLTVTERAVGRDAVAISAGYAYPANAAVAVDVDQTKLDFYTAQRSAFARDGKAAVTAFGRGRQAVAHAPAPHDKQVVDTFSMRGFSAAYAAIQKSCPAK